jgi:2-oxoglutarate dehydrogenase E1 component
LEVTTESQFYGPNLGYVLELYDKYREDPDSVDDLAREFFESWRPPRPGANGHAAMAGVDVDKVVGAAKFVRSIRDFGHTAAQLDPLGSEPPGDPTLDAEFHGIVEEDLETLPSSVIGGPIAERTSSAKEAVEELRRVYCETTGYNFGHIHVPEERFWLRDAVESDRFEEGLEEERAKRLLKRLTQVDTLEKFIHRTFMGQKRFSVEGVDMVVPMLNLLVRRAAETGIPEVVLGMAHRGRLNVLAHVLDKPYEQIFGEFQQPETKERSAVSERSGEGWVGDVKYHLGKRGFRVEESDEEILINLSPNPSHLEHVNPVVEGMARARQEKRDEPGTPEQDEEAALPVLIHGDAAFPGEGIVAETLNLSRLPGYRTGGTIHIITNNQLGFTTESQDARSTTYASDLAKGYEVPVVHVNADDPEACMAAAHMAYAYREEFHKDFVIDLIGYRRFGHNEGDEPAYTQPKMYEKIRNHPTVHEIWTKTLEERGVIRKGEAEKLVEEIWAQMEEIRKNPDNKEGLEEENDATDTPRTPLVDIPETAVSAERLIALNKAMLEWPEGFTPNRKLERLFQKNRGDLDNIDWAHAEALAFASLLEEGTPIRLTGQDSARGTFSHRHAALYDAKTGEAYVPLQNIPQAKVSFAVHNSPLSEIAVLGFEYGYSMNSDDSLLLWEAQYGDFVNVGQSIIDTFIVSGQAKWGQASELVLLLPHGYEGQGPEHSSARLERFLQLAANENVRIANLTTAAQYFHLLRCQAILRDHQRPLIIMAPKSLLRHPLAASSLEDLAEGKFQPVLDDEEARERRGSVRRLVLCSGKFYTELVGSDARTKAESVAVGRIELLYPFPEEDVREMLEGYPNLEEIVWVQEEPKNMGAWTFIEPRLRKLTGEEVPIIYVGKPARPSPAQGSAKFHATEHADLVRRAFGRTEVSEGDKAAVQETQERTPASRTD